MTPKPKPLSCGGKGPCCHIGYAHRHCEHCDEVIAVAPYWWQTINPAPLPIRPYPYWGTYQGTASGTMYMEAAQASGYYNTGDAVRAFNSSASPERTPLPASAAHVCEVK